MDSKRTKNMAKKAKKTLYGDTIVEAVIAIAIYSIVAVLALSSMSSGLSTAQRNLESTMNRAIVDSQSDTLRYYYESYLATKTGKKDDAFYKELWEGIEPKGSTADPVDLDSLSDNSCSALIQADRDVLSGGAQIFALSGRGALSLAKSDMIVYGFGDTTKFTSGNYTNFRIIGNIDVAPLYPRITYKNMSDSGVVDSSNDDAMSILNSDGGGSGYRQSRVANKAEGVWIFPKQTKTGYDFYVRTCWNPVGSKSPSSFTSVVRLYDADK